MYELRLKSAGLTEYARPSELEWRGVEVSNRERVQALLIELHGNSDLGVTGCLPAVKEVFMSLKGISSEFNDVGDVAAACKRAVQAAEELYLAVVGIVDACYRAK